MHRTTILLPDELKVRAERQARLEGLSLSELIRRRLSEVTSDGVEPAAFFKREPWTASAPGDLSARHDDYLYGEE